MTSFGFFLVFVCLAVSGVIFHKITKVEKLPVPIPVEVEADSSAIKLLPKVEEEEIN